MVENIKLNDSNFCIGPQTGTFCSVDVEVSPVVMRVKNSSGTLLRTYTFSPNGTLTPKPYAYSSGSLYVAGQVMQAKSFVFDFADHYGDTNYMGIRSIEFYDADGYLIEMTSSDFISYATSNSFKPQYAFDTSIPKTGDETYRGWLSSRYVLTNQRLICVFNESKYVTKIVVNNYHSSGGVITRGIRNTKIYYTDTNYTNTTYGATDSSFNTVFDSIVNKHVGSDVVDDQALVLESEAASAEGEFVDLKYIGPLNQASIYSGAIFYTLERLPNGYREYYTYERDEVTGELLRDSNGKLHKASEVEYYGNIIRKWRIDNTTFTLELVSSVYKISDDSDWFAAETLTVQSYQTSLLDHVPSGTGLLYFTTTSGLSKYDTVLIGPSSDTDNIDAVEEVYIYSIDAVDNKVHIRTYGGADPTSYEYVEGDPITVIKYAHLPSTTRPLLTSEGIRHSFSAEGGALLSIDLNAYGAVTNRYGGAMFSSVTASDWNVSYNTVSFIKGCNLLHFDLEQEKVIRSQYLLNMYDKDDGSELITIYDISFNGGDLYRLQKDIITLDNTGRQFLHNYLTYNYVVDSLEVYSSTIAILAEDTVVGYQGVSIVTAIVRDQYGVGLLDKEVSFNIEHDVMGSLFPSDGNVVTDANGFCSIQYTAGADFEGITNITAKAVGANSGFGSAYVAGHAAVTVLSKFVSTLMIKNIFYEFLEELSVVTIDAAKNGASRLSCFVRRSTAGGEWVWTGSWADIDNPTIDDRNSVPNSVSPLTFLMTVYQPIFNGIAIDHEGKIVAETGDNIVLPNTTITQHIPESELLLPSEDEVQDSRYLSQNYLSRHLSIGNEVTATLNQFYFTQEAIPDFWSDRNSALIEYWIRLRPFSYSLDISTLSICIKEVSWAGTSETVNIASLGDITVFDAGSGLEGIDFYYKFPTPFHNNAIVFVDVVVYDKAPVPNIITITYWFKIIPDYLKPFTSNKFPEVEAYDVNIDTAVYFDVLDLGDGVDISTLEVFINNKQITYSYTEYEPGQFNIRCNIVDFFIYGQEVKVSVFVKDLSENKNLLRESWTFYCISSSGPWFNSDSVSPAKCLRGVDRSLDDIRVQVYAINDTGIKYDSLRLDVGGKNRNIKITPIIYRLR